jgi:hypothetical protein
MSDRPPDRLEGLLRDQSTGHYRVLPGHGHHAHRYKIHETWLDEEDNLWIDGGAVEREWRDVGPQIFEAHLALGHQPPDAA